MLDIHQIMADLAKRRPVFHSEADFQHALAWLIHETRPDADVRLEFNPSPGADSRMAVDIWVRLSEAVAAIELKYCTHALQQEWDGEQFTLRQHAAYPPRRYDFVKDIQRLEYVRQIPKPADYGFAVLLTNAPLYWTPQTQADAIDTDFRLHDGHRIGGGELRWSENASQGTKRNREEPIRLAYSYNLRWRDYSTLGNGLGRQFRYLAVTVPPTAQR